MVVFIYLSDHLRYRTGARLGIVVVELLSEKGQGWPLKGQRNLKWVSALDWRPSKLEMWNVSSNINTYGTVWINLSPKWDYLKWQKSLELDKIFLWKLFNLLSISQNSQIHRQCHEDDTWLTRDQLVRPRTSRSGHSGRSNVPGMSAGQKGALVQAADFI